MGLFREVGRRVERFKRQVDESKRGRVTHRCAACGKELYTAHDRCPECGEDAVERIGGARSEGEEPASGGDDGSATESADGGTDDPDGDGREGR